MIVVVGKAQIRADAREDAVATCLRMSQLSEAEVGCISYQFYESLAEANTFFLFEEWETAESLQTHLQQPHTSQFGSQLASLLAGPMAVKRYEIMAISDM